MSSSAGSESKGMWEQWGFWLRNQPEESYVFGRSLGASEGAGTAVEERNRFKYQYKQECKTSDLHRAWT